MTEGSDRTLQELIDTMRGAYEQDGKSETWRRSKYGRIFNGILKVYSADLRESQITKDHFDPKQYRLECESNGRILSESTIQLELRTFRRLFMFESDREGYTIAAAARRAGVNYEMILYGWVSEGLVEPSIQPKVPAARGPHTGRLSDADVEVVKTLKGLVKKCSVKEMLDVRANLCEQRPTLARGNEAFSRTKLVFLRGDVCEPMEDGGHISWLYRPGQRLSQAQQSGGLTFGELANLRLEDFKKKGKRVDTLQARHNRLVPILGSTLVSEFDEDFYRQERRKDAAKKDEHLPEHRLDRSR